jgi:hypothetical protein
VIAATVRHRLRTIQINRPFVFIAGALVYRYRPWTMAAVLLAFSKRRHI